MNRRVAVLPVVFFIVLLALGQQALATDRSPQEVKFPQAPSERLPIWRGYGDQVNAILTLPSNATGKVPAVVMIHTRGGYDSTQYDFYGAALREKGIATLGLVLFRSGPTHQPSDLVPHAFGALKYLASRPDIDPNRIGIMGFSLGGILTVLTASEMLASEHMGNGPRFAAHAAFYPVCWIHEEIVRNTPRMNRVPDAYTRLTGSPVHILAGGKDRWDDPDSCQKFLRALAPEARKSVALTFYPDATHQWDRVVVGRYFGAAACRGQGCNVEDTYDPATAEKGKQVVLEFFTAILLRGQAQ
jgi:dienelactone hydrolase